MLSLAALCAEEPFLSGAGWKSSPNHTHSKILCKIFAAGLALALAQRSVSDTFHPQGLTETCLGRNHLNNETFLSIQAK